MENRLVITVKEMSHKLGVSLPTAYALTEQEGFPVVRVGRKKIIPMADFERWLSQQTQKGA